LSNNDSFYDPPQHDPEDNRNQDVYYDYSSIGTPQVPKIGRLERFDSVPIEDMASYNELQDDLVEG
jgi:hypothetical protein